MYEGYLYILIHNIGIQHGRPWIYLMYFALSRHFNLDSYFAYTGPRYAIIALVLFSIFCNSFASFGKLSNFNYFCSTNIAPIVKVRGFYSKK